jgi:EPS-associated MarR family transcriptional regulator
MPAMFLIGKHEKTLTFMTVKRDTLHEDVKFRILRLLQDNPEMSQRELAKAVGASTGSVHYVLNALVEKGLLKLGKFSAAEDKRRFAYILTPHGIAERARLTRRFIIRKLAEYEALKAEIQEVGSDLSASELAQIRSDVKTGSGT